MSYRQTLARDEMGSAELQGFLVQRAERGGAGQVKRLTLPHRVEPHKRALREADLTCNWIPHTQLQWRGGR